MALFRCSEKKDNLLDPNTSASNELAIPVAIAALYNESVFYPRNITPLPENYPLYGSC